MRPQSKPGIAKPLGNRVLRERFARALIRAAGNLKWRSRRRCLLDQDRRDAARQNAEGASPCDSHRTENPPCDLSCAYAGYTNPNVLVSQTGTP